MVILADTAPEAAEALVHLQVFEIPSKPPICHKPQSPRRPVFNRLTALCWALGLQAARGITASLQLACSAADERAVELIA